MNRHRETLMKFISEQNQKIQNDISKQGYKDNSPYKNNVSNLIQGQPGQPTSITMKGVSTPLIGMDEYGNKQYMQPGQEYQFPGSQVTETRVAKYGGLLNKTITCSNCGWSWKAADGGNDVSTCHKCGNENKMPIAQMGGTGMMYADRNYQLGGLKTDDPKRKEYAQKVVALAEDRIKNNNYVTDIPQNVRDASAREGKEPYTCIGGVCTVLKDAGVMSNVNWSNTDFAAHAKDYGFTANQGWGVKGIQNLEPGDLVQYKKNINENGKYYPSHSRIFLGVTPEGNYRFFDNYSKQEEVYDKYTIEDWLDPKKTDTQANAVIFKVNPYNDEGLLNLTPEEKQAYENKKAMIARDSTSAKTYDWSVSPDAKNYNPDTKRVIDSFTSFANDNEKINDLVKKTGRSKEEIQDSLLNVFGELGVENNWTTSKGKGLGSRLENIGESILTSIGGGKGLSVGPGQIKFKNIPADLKEKFNIKTSNDLYDLDKVLPLMTALDLKDKEVLENWGKKNKLSKNLFGFTNPIKTEWVEGKGNVPVSGGFTIKDLPAFNNDDSQMDNTVGRYSPYLRNQYSSIASGTTYEGGNDWIPFNEGTLDNFTEGRFTKSGEDEMRVKYTRDPGSYPYKVEQNWRNNLNRFVTKNEDNVIEIPEVVIQKQMAGGITKYQFAGKVKDEREDAKAVYDNIQPISFKEKRGTELLIKETENAKKDKQELSTTGTIKTPRSIHYKRLAPKQSYLKTQTKSNEELQGQLGLERPLLYLASPEKLLGDLGVPGMETSELDRQAVMANRFNPNQSRMDRFTNNAKIALGYVPDATINTAMAAAFMPEGSGALGLVNEALNPFAGLSTSIAPELRQGLRTAGPSLGSSVDNVNFNIAESAKKWTPEIQNITEKEISYITSPEYLQTRMANTGETKGQVLKNVNKILKNINKTSVNSVQRLPSNEGDYMRAFSTGMTPKKGTFFPSLDFNPSVNFSNKGDFYDTTLGIVDHEIKHAFSPISTGSYSKYKNYPTIDIKIPTDKVYENYLNLPHEQQVRFNKIKDYMEEAHGIKKGTKFTDDDITKLIDDIDQGKFNSRKYSDVLELLNNANPEKASKSYLKEVLNKAWGIFPAALTYKALQEQEETPEYKQGGLTKYQTKGEVKDEREGMVQPRDVTPTFKNDFDTQIKRQALKAKVDQSQQRKAVKQFKALPKAEQEQILYEQYAQEHGDIKQYKPDSQLSKFVQTGIAPFTALTDLYQTGQVRDNLLKSIVNNPKTANPFDAAYLGALGYAAAPAIAAGAGSIAAAATPYATMIGNSLAANAFGVAGLNAGNALTAGFATHGLMNIAPNAKAWADRPSWGKAGDVAMNTLEIAPIVGPAGKMIGEGISATRRALTTQESALAKLQNIRNIAPKLESEIAALKQQEAVAEESRKALYADYKNGQITAEEYSTGAKQLNPNGLQDSRNVLEKQLRDYNIKQEIVNTPQQNILKSENQLGKNISDGGSNTKGVFELGDDHVARLSSYGYDDSSRLINYADKIKSPRTAKTLQVKEINGKVYQVQNKATGTPITQLSETDFQNIPKEHIENFWKDKAELDDLGLSIDISGGKSNVFYDPEKGFQIIDLGIGKGPTNQVISDTYKGLSLPTSPVQNIANESLNPITKNILKTTLKGAETIQKGIKKVEDLSDSAIRFYRSNNFNISKKAIEDINAGNKWSKDWYSNPITQKRYDEWITPANRFVDSKTALLYSNLDNAIPGLETINLDKSISNKLAGTVARNNLEKLITEGKGVEATTSKFLDNSVGRYSHINNDALIDINHPTFFKKLFGHNYNIKNATLHEDTHFVTKGDKGFKPERLKEIKEPFYKPKDINEKEIKNYKYLTKPTEIHARINELRSTFNLTPETIVTDEMVDNIIKLGLKGKTSVVPNFFKLIQDKNGFKNLMNSLPAIVPVGLATGATAVGLSKEKQGGVTGTKQKKALGWINS